MENNWVKVYTTSDPVTAEIVKQGLIENDIAAIVMNKRDSSYLTFGVIEVLVSTKDLESAQTFLNSSDIATGTE